MEDKSRRQDTILGNFLPYIIPIFMKMHLRAFYPRFRLIVVLEYMYQNSE